MTRISSTQPRCDCGYLCRGATLEERVQDGQRHARDAHGIEVTPGQIITSSGPDDDLHRTGGAVVGDRNASATSTD